MRDNPPPVQRLSASYVGRELEAIIPDLFKTKGCGCKNYARNIDRWTLAEVYQRREHIEEHLVVQAKKVPGLFILGPVLDATAKKWVAMAIERVERRYAR